MVITGSMDVPTSDTNIGSRNIGIHHYFHGLIDEVRIYNRALTAAEIMEHYRAGRARLQL